MIETRTPRAVLVFWWIQGLFLMMPRITCFGSGQEKCPRHALETDRMRRLRHSDFENVWEGRNYKHITEGAKAIIFITYGRPQAIHGKQKDNGVFSMCTMNLQRHFQSANYCSPNTMIFLLTTFRMFRAMLSCVFPLTLN